MTTTKLYLCSFADSRLQPTLNRIINEAKGANFFDDVFFKRIYFTERIYSKV